MERSLLFRYYLILENMQVRFDGYWVLYQQKFNETELERIKRENKSLKEENEKLKEEIKDLKFLLENYKEILKNK